jgi:hypothetical protein
LSNPISSHATFLPRVAAAAKIETLEWSLVKRSIDSNSKTHDESRLKDYSSFNARYFG